MSNIIEDSTNALTESLISTLEERYSMPSKSEKDRALFLKAHMQVLIEYQYRDQSADFKVPQEEISDFNAAYVFLTSYPSYAPTALLSFFTSKIQTLEQYQNLRQIWPELALIDTKEELDHLVNQLTLTAALLKTLINFRASLNESDLGSFIPVMGLIGVLVGVAITASLAGLMVGGIIGLGLGFLITSQWSRQEENKLYESLKNEIEPKLKETKLIDLQSRTPLSKDFFQIGLAEILQDNLEQKAPNLKL